MSTHETPQSEEFARENQFRVEGSETPNEITKFSPEAHRAIEEARLPIFTLTGKSIVDLRQSGILVVPKWPDQEYLETLPSRKSEVTVERLYPKNTFNKPMSQQQRLIKEYSRELSTRIPDVEAIIAEAPDYVELNSLWIKRYGTPLFEYDTTLNPSIFPKFLSRLKLFKDHVVTRTATPLKSERGSFVAVVTYDQGAHRMNGWPKEQDLHICGVTPLIIPKKLT